MKPLSTVVVASRLPDALAPLGEIAHNLGWISEERAQDLFRRVDPERWDADALDAVGFLSRTSPERLAELAADSAYTALAAEVLDGFRRSESLPRWFQQRERALGPVAYFSPEFGIADALPQYSGGLGILAGDHLKAASDLGVPLVGVGLFYLHGYFTQSLDRRGWQQEAFPRLRPGHLALKPVEGVTVSVELDGRDVALAVWEAVIGRVHLYLLDSNLPVNDERDRLVTDRLYGGDSEQRIRQEIALGIGGVRALAALGVSPTVFHMNEGHAGFLALERIRRAVETDGMTIDEAVEATRAAQLFTTHTPVPAGIDRFDRALITRYLSGWARACGTTIDRLMEIGHEPGTPDGETLNLAVMGLRLSGAANGVSQLHGDVSRQMFADVWRDLEPHDVPIASVTNGVHTPSWAAPELIDVLQRVVGSDWASAPHDRFAEFAELPDETLWGLRRITRQRLVDHARQRVRRAGEARRHRPSELEWVDEILDPTALTIGFARRFAPYKRATLLLRRPERLRALLLSPDRPVQIVFAGKAHPADDAGKESLRRIANMTSDLDLRGSFVLLEDYAIGVARTMYQGCDVWLNTPRRPMEACGTSGMKAAINGTLNCSILDGWWDELYDGDLGWAIPSFEWVGDVEERDDLECDALFAILEREVVPTFYERDADGLPREWIRRVKASIARLTPEVSASRMVSEYVTRFYEPAHDRAVALQADGAARARELAAWKARVREQWDAVEIVGVQPGPEALSPLDAHHVEVTVHLGALAASDVRLDLLCGPLDDGEQLEPDSAEPMVCVASGEGGIHRFHGEVSFAQPGLYGYTVRVLPAHHDLGDVNEMGLATWARTGGDAPGVPL